MEKRDVLNYVADIAGQLATLCQRHMPIAAHLLTFVALIVQKEIDS